MDDNGQYKAYEVIINDLSTRLSKSEQALERVCYLLRVLRFIAQGPIAHLTQDNLADATQEEKNGFVVYSELHSVLAWVEAQFKEIKDYQGLVVAIQEAPRPPQLVQTPSSVSVSSGKVTLH